MIVSLLVSLLMQPSAPAAVPLYPGEVPLAVGASVADQPTLTPYLVENAMGAPAVVICPGGGYGTLALDHEGKQVAEYFNSLGIHAFVLKYRIATKDRPGPLLAAPLLDLQRAIRTIRARPVGYGVNPNKIGVIGFSAGGHLASTAATHFDAGQLDASDPIEQMSCRPDFVVLAYPVISMAEGITHGGSRRNLLGDNPSAELVAEYSNDELVTKSTPPTFLFHTDEDTAVPPENAARFYLALKKHQVAAELHIYAAGKHGIGLASDPAWTKTKGPAYAAGWPKLLTAWLKERKIIEN